MHAHTYPHTLPTSHIKNMNTHMHTLTTEEGKHRIQDPNQKPAGYVVYHPISQLVTWCAVSGSRHALSIIQD